MKLNDLHSKVKKVLEENHMARNDDFVLVYKVYEELGIPVKQSFQYLMTGHNEYKLPSFESITRARRKIVETHPELQADKKIKEFREVQEEDYIQYAFNF